jgi:ubiquitin-like-conjugating enzyme ATG10
MSAQLSAFPSLTTPEFEAACTALTTAFEERGHKQNDWQNAEIIYHHDTKYLRVTRLLQPGKSDTSSGTGSVDKYEEDELDDQDDLALQTPQPHPLIHYDILLSAVYRVPVLYFHIQDSQHRYPLTMKVLYEHLIAPQFKAQTESGGVIGGVSIQDHPVTNRPVFFIHPCQTAEIMQVSVGERKVSAAEYLTMWIGALGRCVGLNVPLALVQGR